MLKVYFGNDTVKVRQAAFALVAKKELAGATIVTIDEDSFAPGIVPSAASTASLFAGEEIYVLDTPSSNEEFAQEVRDSLSALHESNNLFILIENSLLAPEKKKIEKAADSIEEFKGGPAERFDVFAFADLLARRDKRSLWVHLQSARVKEIPAEEIIGILWWQLKTLRLATLVANAEEAGMKDFSFNKAKQALGKFKTGELESLSQQLLAVYHDGHGGIRDIDLALEKWVLTI